MNNLAYVYKLWLYIAQSSTQLTTSDILLVSKRLVEGQSNQDIDNSIKEFDTLLKVASIEITLDNLRQEPLSKKYIILINLFMSIMLKSIHKEKIDSTQITTLKEIYKQLEVPFLYDVLYFLLHKKYQKAHKVLNEFAPNINFICFDTEAKSELNQSFKMHQVSFIIFKINNFFLLLNNHSHDLHIYTYENKYNISLEDKCETFKKESFSFQEHNIRNHSIYYLNKKSFLRIVNEKQCLSFDRNTLFNLFSPQNNNTILITELIEQKENNLHCSIVKDHIYNIEAKNLYAGYSNKKPIDKDVNFNISEGELVAIMGPSGSGKTTLLRSFIHQAKILNGELLINHEKISTKYFHRMGYVSQDDVLSKDLNVYDNMFYYYRLHFGDDKTDNEVDTIISTQLRDLGIFDIKYSPVFKNGKYTISGGQRKRLNIALELLKDVDLILMDEPTSGLSSLDSETIIQELKNISLLNKIVIINIHQPSSVMYRQFSQVIVFNEEGYNIYTDNSKDVLKIFKLVKSEDTFMFNSIQESKEDIECLKCNKTDPELLLEIQANETSNFWKLFRYLNNFTEK